MFNVYMLWTFYVRFTYPYLARVQVLLAKHKHTVNNEAGKFMWFEVELISPLYGFKYSHQILIILKLLYLTYAPNMTSAMNLIQSGPGINDNEGVTRHSPKIQKWILIYF